MLTIEPDSLVALIVISNLHKDLKAIILVYFDSTHSKLRAFLI